MTTKQSDPQTPGALDLIPQAVAEALDLWCADVWSVSPEGDTLSCLGSWSRDASAESCAGVSVPLVQSEELRRLVLAGETLERHADDEGLSPAAAAALRSQDLQSRIDVPLRLGDEALGVLSLGERRAVRRLTTAERELLRRLCDLAALALRGEVRTQRADDHSRHLQDLVRSGQAMVESLRVQATIAQARALAVSLLPGLECRVEIPLLKDDGTFARVVPSLGEGAEPGADYEAWPADALAKQVARSRHGELERDREGRTRLVLPLTHDDRVLGLIDIRAGLTRAFREREVQLLQLLAGQVATALLNARALRTLEQRSATDSLTGLYGRWYFYERLTAEVARSRRYSQPLSLLMLEVDDLEGVMAPGRPAGERVLRAVAQIVQGCLRDKVDVPCRHGMSSFAVLLPATPPGEDGACLVAERVRQAVAQTELGDDDLGALGRFTVSVGVAGFPEHCEDADELAALAEEAMHAAHRARGDRVVRAGSA